MQVDNLYVGLKNVVSYLIEDNMASNGHLYHDALGRRMDEVQNSWEIYLDIKISDFISGPACDFKKSWLAWQLCVS